MIRRPPRSTLFPYDALPISGYNWRALVEFDIARWKRVIGDGLRSQRDGRQATAVAIAADVRSEEHTSELQSRQYLVCRLLLDKKKHKRTQFILSYSYFS